MTNLTSENLNLIKWKFFPDLNTFSIPSSKTPIPKWPFNFHIDFLENYIYPLSLNGYVPITIAIIYFSSVHLMNKIILNKQISQFNLNNEKNGKIEKLPKNLKTLKPVPYKISTYKFFKFLVLIHNIFLCIYSVWTFIGMTSTMYHLSKNIQPNLFKNIKPSLTITEKFWQSVCNKDEIYGNIWSNIDNENLKGLTFYAYLFYLSKYYEILDTIIILLKGRPSSLLQSYHHSGAILCMWSGTRYMSSPIWIFVVFNSFIHSLMYFYFSLSCLKIRLPIWFKQSLTTLQILQFIIGGSTAVIHLFIRYYDLNNNTFKSCISTSEQAVAVYINVFYLAPLTLLFAAFYVDSYKRKRNLATKKDQ